MLKRGFKQMAVTILRQADPSLPPEEADKIAEEVSRRAEQDVQKNPPAVAIIGEVGVGKSSTLNALFNSGLEVGNAKATTQEAKALEINLRTTPSKRNDPVDLVFYDLPGLGESIARSAKHRATYDEVLKTVDVAVWVLSALHGPMEAMQRYLKDELGHINSELLNRMVFAVNKIDLVEPRNWSPYSNVPSPEQTAVIGQRIADVRQKIVEALPNWDGEVVAYSAAKHYNLALLFEVMLRGAPSKRRWMIQRQKRIAKFQDKLDKQVRSAMEANPDGPTEALAQPTTADLIRGMSPEEFREQASSPAALAKWLEENSGSS